MPVVNEKEIKGGEISIRDQKRLLLYVLVLISKYGERLEVKYK